MNRSYKTHVRHVVRYVLALALGLFAAVLILETGIRVGGFVLRSVQACENWLANKQSGTYRILCLGESTTQGQYPKRLESFLNERNVGIRFSVTDKGRPSANTSTILTHLDEDLAESHPNLVIAMMGINDRDIKYYQGIASSRTWLFEHFRTYKFLQILWMNFIKKVEGNGHCVSNAVDLRTNALLSDRLTVTQGTPAKRTAFEREVSNDYLLGGQRLAKQGACWLAKSSFEKSIALDPNNDDAHVGLGRLFFRILDEPALAANRFRSALAINPQNDQAYSELGWVHLWQGESQLAEHFFKRSLELNPNNDSTYVGLGILFQHEIPKAEDYFKKALALNPKNFRAFLGLGGLSRSQGDISKAESFYKKALELNPKNFTARTSLATIHRLHGEFDQAEDLLKNATGLNPEKNERKLRGLASIGSEFGKTAGTTPSVEDLALLDSDYSAVTFDNYHRLKEVLDSKGIKLVCVQYPMRNVNQLKKMFDSRANVFFVDNEKIFKEAVQRNGYTEYFTDMFGGDFGHCTQKGNELLARNIADIILREVFGIR